MPARHSYEPYVKKMRGLIAAGKDLATEARFVDMISQRHSKILDIGCGHGSSVTALRQRGHEAYGIDPTDVVLDTARDLSNPAWFRRLGATELESRTLLDAGLPDRYDLLLLAGNVAAFLTATELEFVFVSAATLLNPGGHLIIGTTAETRGGPPDQDAAVSGTSLTLQNRFADWHLAPYRERSQWPVSVYLAVGTRADPTSSEGIFVLDR
jgi:predicted TPR repeat methyltransferase